MEVEVEVEVERVEAKQVLKLKSKLLIKKSASNYSKTSFLPLSFCGGS